MEFSGAVNSLYLTYKQNGNRRNWTRVENGEETTSDLQPVMYDEVNAILELKGDRQPIGSFPTMKPFTKNILSLEPGDIIYTISDGFPDQMGGPNLKKFKYKPLRALFLGINGLSTEKRKHKIETIMTTWMSDHDQLDDILIMGGKNRLNRSLVNREGYSKGT